MYPGEVEIIGYPHSLFTGHMRRGKHMIRAIMSDVPEREVIHLHMEENLPAKPVAVPAAEMFKQIIEQMLENERRRVRNEFLKFSCLMFGILFLLLGGLFWFAGDVLRQMKTERRLSEASLNEILNIVIEREAGAPMAAGPVARAERKPPAPAERPPEIQQAIAEIEGKSKALADLMQTHDKNVKALVLDLLREREEKIQKLHLRLDTAHAQAEDAEASGTEAETETAAPYAKYFTVTVADGVPLRLPIPVPAQ